jgi:hypothetical protein
MILVRLWLSSLLDILHIKQSKLIGIVFFVGCMLYTYKGLRNFYEQRRAKTIAKFIILSMSCILVALIVVSAALSISALTM